MTWFLDKEFLAKLDLAAYDAAAIAKHTGVSLKKAKAFVDPARTCWVKSAPEYGWLAGGDGEGRPTLVFVGAPRLAAENVHPLNAITFVPRSLELVARPLPYDGTLDEWAPILGALEESIGFMHVGNAPVRPFKFPGIWHYALVPFPFHLHDAALGEGDEDERNSAREWIKSESFVLHCGNAYFMRKDGSVESS